MSFGIFRGDAPSVFCVGNSLAKVSTQRGYAMKKTLFFILVCAGILFAACDNGNSGGGASDVPVSPDSPGVGGGV